MFEGGRVEEADLHAVAPMEALVQTPKQVPGWTKDDEAGTRFRQSRRVLQHGNRIGNKLEHACRNQMSELPAGIDGGGVPQQWGDTILW